MHPIRTMEDPSNVAQVVLRTADGSEGTEVVELLKGGTVKHQPMSWDREPELQTVSADIRVGNDCLSLTGDDWRDIDNHGTDENFWKPLLRGNRALAEIWQQFLENELGVVPPARPRPR